MFKAIFTLTILTFLLLQPSPGHAACSVDSLLEERVNAAPLALTPVMITFDHQPAQADFDSLRALGIHGGYLVSGLPIIQTAITREQLVALRARADVLSLYADRQLRLLNNKARTISGVQSLRTDSQVTSLNGGMPMSGKGVVIAHVDTGIDATHPDVKLGSSVVGNVLFPTAHAEGVVDDVPSDFIPSVFVEDQPFTDIQGGHGTFGAAVISGIGLQSGGLYGGMAPGGSLLGLVAGNDAGLSSFAVVRAYGYVLANPRGYNLRVCNNSFGTTLRELAYDPHDPVNVATRAMHDRGIVVVFAAGNDGDRPGAINPYSIAPWVISVAAGEKEIYGAPASFSSRGNDNGTGTDTPGQPANPYAAPNMRPDITGSGVNIKSARAKGPGFTSTTGLVPLLSNDARTLPPAYLVYYTTSQGTSFAAAQVSGIVAMMMEANPLLTPDEVLTVLRNTATPMPHEERVVGAGYVDARNAVRSVMNLTAVAHPANLTPPAGTPEIVDAAAEHGTGANDALDILSADFHYNPASRQARYTLTLSDLAQRSANNQWRINSNFFDKTIFVSAALLENGQMRYRLGTINYDTAGIPIQTTIPSGVDAGTVSGNQIIIWVSIDKISAAVGRDVYGTTSTATTALSQILVGANGAGTLFDADVATGANFIVNNPVPAPATNVALAANGGVATASSVYPNDNYSPSGANNGDRQGVNWGNGGGWGDATRDVWPDWLQVEFNGTKVISEIRVYTLQDDFNNPQEPTASMTATLYGLLDFDVQSWDGSQWVTVPGGAIRGNDRVIRTIGGLNVTTTKIRVYVLDARSHFSRIIEVEAFVAD